MKAGFIELKSPEELEKLFEKSDEKPVLFFKHSLTCPISQNVFKEISEVNSDINLIIVQTARHISNEIAKRTNVRHESPQAIILKNKKAVYHASHYDISAEDIENCLKAF
jgi:bacillithiol system protein YtxJ